MKTQATLLVMTVMMSWPAGASPTGAAFLNVDAGARAAGMGSAFTAAADDATAAFWNPAGLAGLTSREASATHADWIGDVRLEHLVYAQPFSGGVLAGSLTHQSQGRIDSYGDDRRSLGSFQAQDSAAAVSLGRRLSPRSSYGLTARWIDQRIGDARAAGFSMDAGFQAVAGPRLAVGAALRNLGPSQSFAGEKFRLPAALGVGVKARLGGGLSVAADVRRPLFSGKTSLGVGTEYWLMDRVALRAGYLSAGGPGAASSGDGSRNTPWSMQMGLGLRISSYRIDYALTPAGDLGDAHRLSLSARF